MRSTRSENLTIRALLVALCIALVGCALQPAAIPTAAVMATYTPMPTSTPSLTPAPTDTRTATTGPTSTRTPNATATPSVETVEPVVRRLDLEEFEFRNCDNVTEDLVRLVSSLAPVHDELSIAEFGRPVAGGEQVSVPDELLVALEAYVRATYQVAFARAHAEGAADEFVVAPDKVITFRVLWEEQAYTGSVSFRRDDIAYRVEYVYTLLVPKRAGYRMISCTA